MTLARARPAALLSFALFVAACGGEDDTTPSGDTQPAPPAASQPADPSHAPDADGDSSSESDAQLERDQAFFFRMDDLAIQLDDVIGQALDGDPGAVERIRDLRRTILRVGNRRLIRDGKTSIGANLLTSAATQARDAARIGDLARLADARREVAAARDRLAAEATE